MQRKQGKGRGLMLRGEEKKTATYFAIGHGKMGKLEFKN